ncbi:MAG: penicillin-binding protein 2 [Verrucomicrobiota bacterium]|nr:penicillin-binding protein 2 [Verrucomicrobiota bacterium]
MKSKTLPFLAISFFFLFSLLIARFYQIQVIEGEKWTKLAAAQHQRTVSIPAKRGSFYSNVSMKKGHPEEPQVLVMDVPKFHLFVDPASIPSEWHNSVVRGLSDLLQLSPADGVKVKRELEKKSRSRRVALWLSREVRQKVENWWKPFAKERKIVPNALFFTLQFQRSYPFGSLLGALLHTVQDERDPETGAAIPTGGLEYLFDPFLRGKEGRKAVVHSPSHSLDTGTILDPVEHGADVYLTVNHYIQAIVERELQKGIDLVGAHGGWAVMLDPWTGEIWALAQLPSFDPAHYSDFFNRPELLERTRVKAVTDCYEPGSIFKPITMAIALLANEERKRSGGAPLFTPEEKMPCAHGWFPGRSTPLKDARVYNFLNMDMALQKSSNIYMARIAQRIVETMGEEWYRNALVSLFGFGLKTEVEIPGENPGFVPKPGKLYPNGKLQWSAPTPYSLAMGHSISINAMQVVKSYALLANGGKEVQPHLVRKIVKEGKVVLDKSSLRATKPLLPEKVCARLVRSLKFATKEGGTCKRADVMGYTEAGKSGTAEKVIEGGYSKDHNISSFVGFAPATHPRFVLLVSVDDPEKKTIPNVGKQQYGGIAAAPVFREIATQTLEYLGETPDDPYGFSPGDPRRDPKRADWVREVQELRELYEKWNHAGIYTQTR